MLAALAVAGALIGLQTEVPPPAASPVGPSEPAPAAPGTEVKAAPVAQPSVSVPAGSPPAWPGVPPEPLRHRSPGAGALLGGAVGFGAGYYYAGEPAAGTVYTVIDGLLVVGFVSAEVALNQLVVEHDFRSGNSLARGERPKGRREANLYVAAIALAGLTTASHLFQAIGSYQAAGRTNALLDRVSIAPLSGGAAFRFGFEW